jgi:hypothetical protein
MMNDFKAYASRALNESRLDSPDCKRWTRHGSTRYINDEAYLAAATNYVLYQQGDPMENGRGSSIINPRRVDYQSATRRLSIRDASILRAATRRFTSRDR